MPAIPDIDTGTCDSFQPVAMIENPVSTCIVSVAMSAVGHIHYIYAGLI